MPGGGGWLYLWTTNRYLPHAFDIADGWGFQYRQTVVWHKTGTPSPFPATIAPLHAEYLLVCRRGTPRRAGTWPTNVIAAPMDRRYRHSQKPEVFLDMVETVTPGPYLEMFSRRARFGWDVWGNEVNSTVEVLT